MALIALSGDGECTTSFGSSANSYNARSKEGNDVLIALPGDGECTASSGSSANSYNARSRGENCSFLHSTRTHTFTTHQANIFTFT